MPHTFIVTVHLDPKDPGDEPAIMEHLVIADSLEQIVSKAPINGNPKELVHERIIEIRLLASTSSTAAPMPLIDFRDMPDGKPKDQGKETAQVH